MEIETSTSSTQPKEILNRHSNGFIPNGREIFGLGERDRERDR